MSLSHWLANLKISPSLWRILSKRKFALNAIYWIY